jgi:hypothetical protein
MSNVVSNVVSNVIPFRKKKSVVEPIVGGEIDLLTAVDAAIRDLRDIADRCDDTGRRQADECRLMLERAFAAVMHEA